MSCGTAITSECSWWKGCDMDWVKGMDVSIHLAVQH